MIGCGDGIYLGGINMDYGSPVGIAGYLLVGGAVVVVLLNTLFYQVSHYIVFERVLKKFFGGEMDQKTISILEESGK